MKNQGKSNLLSESHIVMPRLNSVLIISLGLIIVAILSSNFVYAETALVNVEGNSFDVEDIGDGVSVTGIEPDLDFISLIFSVDVTTSPGTLDVTFERSFFDSVYQGNDDDFIVLADGDEPGYSETETTAQTRTLSITLPSGTDEVEIIGSVFGQPTTEPTPEPTTTPDTTPVPTEDSTDEDKPKTECGSGTILKDGVCQLDERCGPGTVLKNGICVIESTSTGTSFPKSMGRELIYGTIAAFVIAGTVGVILGIMSKASKSS